MNPDFKKLTVGDLKSIATGLPDNISLGIISNHCWQDHHSKALQWRIVQDRKTKKLFLIIGDDTISKSADLSDSFHERYKVLNADQSYHAENENPEFRRKRNEETLIQLFED